MEGRKAMRQFEYKVVETKAKAWLAFGGKIDAAEAEIELNEMGRQGWELVETMALIGSGSTRRIVYLFKREIVLEYP
ncbi:MAG: DUF4177 domain-containing protein [Methanomassiliicoccaceae archaeon]|nr:DUF4177 domain-containing protein [Methanomassiliicoccaceae archaeon]